MLDGSIGDLGSNQNIEESCDAEKPGDALHRRLAIEGRFGQTSANLALAQVHTDRNQQQPSEENCWNKEKDHNPDVGIIHMATNLLWQHKEPGDQSSRDQGHAQQTQPVLS